MQRQQKKHRVGALFMCCAEAYSILNPVLANAFSNGPGTGSTFTVSIPRIRDEGVPPQDAGSDEAGTRNLSILVVDDNVDAASSLAILLKAIGHQVMVASTAQDVMDKAELEPVDVFILDIGLPDMTGYELARALRQRPALANKIFIALTGYGQEQDRLLSKEAGFAHHFVKPVNNQLLFKVLAEVNPSSTRA